MPLTPKLLEARATLIRAFSEDPEYLFAYVANAAVVIMDYQSELGGAPLDFQDPVIRDEVAFRVLNWLFGPGECNLPPYERLHRPPSPPPPPPPPISLPALERVASGVLD